MINKGNTGQKMLAGVDNTLSRPKVSPPTELSKLAKKAWRKLVNSVPNDHFTVSDFPIMAVYCESYAMMVEARKALDEEGKMLEDSQGKRYQNPWLAAFFNAEAKLIGTTTKLRLCPSGRKANNRTDEKPTPSKPTTKLGSLIAR